MRRLLVVAVLCALLIPKPAYAWFGFLDYLSGPGRWYGQLYDLRVACLGGDVPYSARLREALARASYSSAKASLGVADPDQAKALAGAATNDWQNVNKVLSSIAADYPVLSTARLQLLKKRLRPLLNAGSAETEAAYQQFGTVLTLGQDPFAPDVNGVVPDALQSLVEAAERLEDSTFVANGVGVFISTCSSTERKRWAVDLNADFYQAKSDGIFAQDFTIRLITFVPTVSHRLFDDPTHDFVDLRWGAGRYHFSSRGMGQSVSGWVVLPTQVDFHGPTAWKDRGGVKAFLSLTTVRAGFSWFVGGFDAGAFNALPPDRNREIGNELVPTYAVYVNLTPLFRR